MGPANKKVVMVLPWYIIRRIQISSARKIGLAAIFSVVLVTIACDILRTIKSFSQALFAQSALYSILEVTLAVVVSCMPIYRALLKARPKEQAKKPVGGAFAPINERTEQPMLKSSNTQVQSPNEGRLANYVRRLSHDIFQRNGGDNGPRSEQQHLTSNALQAPSSVHLRSLGQNSVDASSIV